MKSNAGPSASTSGASAGGGGVVAGDVSFATSLLGSGAEHANLAQYISDSNEALHFRWIDRPDQLEEDAAADAADTFRPEMTHQIYGDQENIFGYRGLRVDLWMTPGRLKAFIAMKAEETFSGQGQSDSDGVKPDPVVEPLVQLLAPGQLCNSRQDFLAAVRQDHDFKPMGNKLCEWRNHNERHFEVFECDLSVPGFREYHARLQPWIMFYIDAASYIDSDDDHWHFFLTYERRLDSEDKPFFSIVGYATVYGYYAYPNHMRPRVSQMLVLPNYQQQGVGAKLLDTLQRFYWGNSKVVDITVEDPSEQFVRLRDFVDAQNCLKLTSFGAAHLQQGFTDTMAKEAKERYKLCKRQARRVYEILRLRCTKRQDKQEYKRYRVDVKKRLNAPFQKEQRQLDKLKKVLKSDEYAAATLNITNKEQRLENLQKEYEELEEQYQRIVERLARS